MATTGQTINDRLNAVRYALAGQGLARTVCKATTEEVQGPKKKHIDYLLACTDEPNVSIPQLANLLIDRSQHTSWTVVFKSLITIHHLFNYGNERFTQYLATSNHSFELKDFMDRTTPQGYGMSAFVRSYAKYINEKISSYRTLAIDLCKVKPGKDNGLRTMNMDNLTKTLPVVHNQFDSLLEFGVEAKDLNNGIIMAAFKLLYKDLNRIFVAYQEAIINLIERYFKLSRKKTREALNMYKKYLERMDKVANFFKVVEQVGLDKSEMPNTSKLTSLLGVLEEHLSQLEAKKRGANIASPEVDDEAEGVVTSNKENHESANEVTKKTDTENDNTQSSKTQDIVSSSSVEHSRKAPPARPSPVVTAPKVLPSTSKPTTSDSCSTPSATLEKKAPPERPAKPPSRPPRPSVAHQSPVADVSSSIRSASDEHKPENPSDDSNNVIQATEVTSPTPEPPPLSQSDQTSSPMSVNDADESKILHANGSGIEVETNNQNSSEISRQGSHQANVTNGREHDHTPLPTCANSTVETVNVTVGEEQTTEETSIQQSVEENVMLNNVSNHHQASPDDEPPPPQPLED